MNNGNTFFFPWEVNLMEWLQTHLDGAGVSVVSLFSMFGEELLLILILGFLYWCYDKNLARTVGLSVIMGLVWNTMAKNIVLRRRPYFDHEGIKILRVVEPKADIYDIAAQGYSFPSGHSTNVATLFASLAVNLRRRWVLVVAIVIPLLTGFSRIVVGAHYPTDVLGGLLLGVITVAIIQWLQKRIKRTLLLYGILLLTALPGFFFCKSADYFTAMGLLAGFMGGTLLEERYVHFENTRKPLAALLRVLGGLTLFFALSALLKMPFSSEFLSSGSTAALLVRCARYAIIAFVEFGIYPMLFPRQRTKDSDPPEKAKVKKASTTVDFKVNTSPDDNTLQEVRTTELVRTSQSWDGAELPDYLVGRPEIVGVKYEIPAGQKLGWHDHPVMNFGILVQGDLTIISQDGLEKVVHGGEAVVEMVGTVHHGENRGTKPVVLYMFYLSQEGLPLSVQHPERPIE